MNGRTCCDCDQNAIGGEETTHPQLLGGGEWRRMFLVSFWSHGAALNLNKLNCLFISVILFYYFTEGTGGMDVAAASSVLDRMCCVITSVLRECCVGSPEP